MVEGNFILCHAISLVTALLPCRWLCLNIETNCASSLLVCLSMWKIQHFLHLHLTRDVRLSSLVQKESDEGRCLQEGGSDQWIAVFTYSKVKVSTSLCEQHDNCHHVRVYVAHPLHRHNQIIIITSGCMHSKVKVRKMEVITTLINLIQSYHTHIKVKVSNIIILITSVCVATWYFHR